MRPHPAPRRPFVGSLRQLKDLLYGSTLRFQDPARKSEVNMTNPQRRPTTTSQSVLALLGKSQASGTRFSHTERVLYTACEFWVAATNHSLTRYLGGAPRIVLRDAEAAFAAIEIECVANLLRDARNALSVPAPAEPADRVLARLQQQLDQLPVSVEDMIGKFAAEQTWSRLKRPTFEPGMLAGGDHAEHRAR
jgi:hypothetical protein